MSLLQVREKHMILLNVPSWKTETGPNERLVLPFASQIHPKILTKVWTFIWSGSLGRNLCISQLDMHGLIQEVQRISESHKTLMNEKSDIKLRLDNFEDSLNRNIVGIPTARVFASS